MDDLLGVYRICGIDEISNRNNSHPASRFYRKLQTAYGIHASMGGTDVWRDDSVVERFFGNLCMIEYSK